MTDSSATVHGAWSTWRLKISLLTPVVELHLWPSLTRLEVSQKGAEGK